MPPDPAGSFRAHLNYLTAFATVIDQTANPPLHSFLVSLERVYEALTTVVVGNQAYHSLRARPADHLVLAAPNLKNAWTTELLLNLTGQTVDREVMGMANNWGVVQAYYACYHAFQSLHILLGQPPLDSHEKARSAFADFWSNRNHLYPPWCFVWTHEGPLNAPASCDFSALPHPWQACTGSTCWGIAGLALKSTREEWIEKREEELRASRLKGRRDDWLKMNQARAARGLPPLPQPQRAQLTLAEKGSLAQRVRPASLLDYLYRLRLRCNYQDAMMFTEGPEHQGQAETIHLHLRRIVAATLLLHELYVAKLVGKPALLSLVDEWANAGVVRLDRSGVLARRQFLDL